MAAGRQYYFYEKKEKNSDKTVSAQKLHEQ